MNAHEDKINQIIELSPIEEIIGLYITLKKAGKNFKTNCPFHPDKTPSFFVSPDKGVYHCFGCGKSGNVFTFIMEYNNMTFYDALNFLAERAGVKLDTFDEENYELYKLNEEVANFYHSKLLSEEGNEAKNLLYSRGINDTTINNFLIGYAPKKSSLINKGLNIEKLKELGLIYENEDTFLNKIIFPIRNRRGRVVGFGSRVLDNSLPKYINSKETPLFKKSNILYGIYEAKENIKNEVIIVEGYMDLISVYQSGTKNVVASLGTALTQQQARLLKFYTKNVIIAYDSDEAGKKATRRAIDIFLENSFDNIYVLTLPEGEDPDSFVRKHSKLNLDKKINFIDFLIQTEESRENLIKNLQESLSKMQDLIKKEIIAEIIAEKINIKKEFLLVKRTVYNKGQENIKKSELEELEAELLGIIVNCPKTIEILERKKFEFYSQEIKEAMEFVKKGYKAAEIETLLPEKLRKRFTKMCFYDKDIEHEKMANDYVDKINYIKKKEEAQKLKEKIKKGEYTEEVIKNFESIIKSIAPR